MIDINRGDAPGPPAHAIYAGSGGNILKTKATLVQVKFVRYQVAGEIQVLQAIIIEISCCDPAAIIDVLEIDYIDRIILDDGIGEIYPGAAGLHHAKELTILSAGNPTGGHQQKGYKRNQPHIQGIQ
jgi:hypothetical protein